MTQKGKEGGREEVGTGLDTWQSEQVCYEEIIVTLREPYLGSSSLP